MQQRFLVCFIVYLMRVPNVYEHAISGTGWQPYHYDICIILHQKIFPRNKIKFCYSMHPVYTKSAKINDRKNFVTKGI